MGNYFPPLLEASEKARAKIVPSYIPSRIGAARQVHANKIRYGRGVDDCTPSHRHPLKNEGGPNNRTFYTQPVELASR